MFGRSDADFRAHRNRRKSRLGKYNGELDKHFIPQPSPIAPRRTLGGRMNQLLYQEAAYKRKSVAAKANPKKCLFSEPGHENTRYYSTKDKKTVSYSNEYGFSTVEDHEVTGVYPMGGRNMEPQFTSGVRLPLKDHNFRSTTTTKPIHQLFKNFSTVTDSAKKCLKKQQPLQWNVVQSPVLPQLSGFPNSKTPHAQKSLNIQSPVMPRLSTLPYSIKSAMKINIVPPEEKRKPEEDDIVDLELKGSDFQISTKVQKEPSIVPNFKYPITDEPKEVFPNFRYPICGELNDCGKEQIKLSNYEQGRTNSVIDDSKPLDLNLKFPVKVGSNTVDSNFPIKGGSNSGNVVTNFNFPRESKSATDLSNFGSPARLNDSELNLTRPLNLCKPLLYSEKDMSKDTNVKNDKLLMVDEKTKRMNERQRKMSVSEMEFEKICQMRSEGSQSLLTDFCHNGKSDSEDNDFDNKKQAKENIEPKKVTNGGRRSVSSNIMNGNGTRRSISSNFINGNGSRSSINTIENVAQCSKLKLPQCYTTQVDKKLQQISVPNLKESPKFVIRKRKDSCIADDTVGEDSFNNYDTISNNYYDSSTLIVNDQNVDTSLKAVDGIDETLSNIQLDDVAETFSKHDEVKTFLKHDVTENLGGKSCYGVVSKTVVRDQDNKVENVGKTFVVEKNLFEGKFCKEDGASNGNLLDSQRNLNFGPNSKRNLNFESNSERNLNLELNSQRNLNLESNSERKQNFGDTFLIPHTSQKVLLGDKKFCRDNRVSILNASLNNEELNNQSLGVDMLNDSLDNTLRFVQNETLCQEEDEDSEVKNCGKIDVGEGINAKRNLEEELQQEIINDGSNLKQEVIVRMNLNLEMDGMRMGEDVENIGENFVKNMETAEINTSAQNCRNPSSIDDVVLEKGKEHQANFIKNLLERHKLLVAKSENLFQSRKRIMSQIKSLEETLIEQEDEFNELNCEFVALFKEFGEVVSKEKSCEMSFDRENECNASTSNMITNEKVSESVIVPFSVRKTVLDTPKSARRVRRNLVFTQLKSEFSCLKTPLPSTAKKLHESTVNKTILTPQSMSVCIQDQVNQLFDS